MNHHSFGHSVERANSIAHCRRRYAETGRFYMLVFWPESPETRALAWPDCAFNRQQAKKLDATCVRVKPADAGKE